MNISTLLLYIYKEEIKLVRRSVLVIVRAEDVRSAISGRGHILYRLLQPYVDGVIITVAESSTKLPDKSVKMKAFIRMKYWVQFSFRCAIFLYFITIEHDFRISELIYHCQSTRMWSY